MADLEKSLELLHKKLDKILNMQTKIAKTLHLIPVTEKEEREIYITRLKNSALTTKVAEEVSQMQPQPETPFTMPGMAVYMQDMGDAYDYFSDVLADDINGKRTGG